MTALIVPFLYSQYTRSPGSPFSAKSARAVLRRMITGKKEEAKKPTNHRDLSEIVAEAWAYRGRERRRHCVRGCPCGPFLGSSSIFSCSIPLVFFFCYLPRGGFFITSCQSRSQFGCMLFCSIRRGWTCILRKMMARRKHGAKKNGTAHSHI